MPIIKALTYTKRLSKNGPWRSRRSRPPLTAFGGADVGDSSIRYEKRGQVVRLSIDRPHVLNAMDTEAHEVLSACLDRCEQDDDVRVVVLTGTGERAFSVGRDLKSLTAENAMNPDEKTALEARWRKIRRLTDRHDFTKPIIARVNGLALGGGFEIALACDIIIAADTASFALPEPKRGLIPLAGGTQRLPRQVPLKIAMGHLLTGRSMSSQRAYELGLVNTVVAFEALDAEVERWVSDILSCAPMSIRAIKQSVMEGAGLGLPEALAATYSFETARCASADSIEGPRAFAEKRQPVWTET